MIEIKLVIMAVCSGLYLWGGQGFLPARRFIMPTILAISISFFTHCWWLGLTTLPCIGGLCLGYGEKSVLKHIVGDAWGRFVWMALGSLTIALGLVISHHLPWWQAFLYVLTNAFLCLLLRQLDVFVCDPIFGGGLSSILLWI